MTYRFAPVCIVAIFALSAAARPPVAQSPASSSVRWFKGNTHTHTLNSDGDSTPDEVVRWYREHGYNFLVLTDHNYLTAVDGLNALHGAADKFLVVRGEEVTSTASSKAVHVNGLNVDALVKQSTSPSVVVATQENVDGIRRADGIPHINHPNFRWAMTTDDLMQVQRTRLFEIFNGHPQVNNEGGGGSPGLEEIWDRLLTSGRLMYGIAVDDAHHFKRPGDPLASGPGAGGFSSVPNGSTRARIGRGDRARRLLRVDRCRARARRDATASAITLAVRRPRTAATAFSSSAGAAGCFRGDHGHDGELHLQGRRGLRPREGARVQRLHGVDAARTGRSGRS